MLVLEHTCPCLRVVLVEFLLCRLTQGRVPLFISSSSALSLESSTVPGTQEVQNKQTLDE